MTGGTVVVDTSWLVAAVTDRTPTGTTARSRLVGQRRHAPHLIDAELGNVLRRMIIRGELTAQQADRSRQLAERSVQRRHPANGPLAERAWQLRHNLSFYDALYVALAESLGCRLLTLDHRLAKGAPSGVDIEVI